MRYANTEEELYDHRFVVAAHFQLPHFRGFYSLLFDRLSDLDLVCYERPLSEDFLGRYKGNIIVHTKLNTASLMKRPRHYRTIHIDHGPLPPARRSWERFHCDHLIVSGSEELASRIDFELVGKVHLNGYFPVDYFSADREGGKVLVQVTEEHRSSMKAVEACRLLLDLGYQTCIYNHVAFKTDFSGLPAEVSIIRPGLDYVHALSSCSHFVFCGTSGNITCMYTPGCRLLVLGDDWLSRNTPLYSEVTKKSSRCVDDARELKEALDGPSLYDSDLRDYLHGRERGGVIERIRKTLSAIG